MANDVTLRSTMAPIGSRVRAYFAAVERSTGNPAIFDPAKHGCFALDSPPSPWIDVGWVENLQRLSSSTLEEARGSQGVVAQQFRVAVGASVQIDFCDWGKLQMALSAGTQHMNALVTDPNAEAEPAGGSPIAAVAVLPGSTAQEIILGAGAVDMFATGDLIAVDVDYQQQVGYVGTGIAGAYVNSPDDVGRDVNYVRRVTFNVGKIKEKTATSVLLAQPLPGGAPGPIAGAQKVVAFLDREGGNFLQEWSALFVAGEESGGRICYYYPRLRPGSGVIGKAARPISGNRESVEAICEQFNRIALHATLEALPVRDSADHEHVVCYRSYFPARCAPAY